MFVLEERIGNYIRAAQILLEHKGQSRYAEILRDSKFKLLAKTGFDNWDGGQYFHTLQLTVPLNTFELIVDDLSNCCQSLKEVLNKVSGEVKNESLEAVDIAPDVDNMGDLGLEKIRTGVVVKTAFDEYVIERQIGAGGNGRVFSARNSFGSQVAIKFLECDNSEKRRRFRNEISFCERNTHPNIVNVLDRGIMVIQGQDRIFCVMPLYEESLRAKISKGLSPVEAINIFTELIGALEEAHRHGVVHRDVKPENVMFAPGSLHPVLCDFGIAHLPKEFQETFVVTRPTSRMANFVYAAPEQKSRMGAGVGPEADLYAMGLILNEMFTREVPSAAGHKKIGDVAPDYAFLDEVVDALYQQDPQKRLAPASKVLADFRIRISCSKNQYVLKAMEEAQRQTPPDNFDLFVVRKQFAEPYLLFGFNKPIPEKWLETLRKGSYNHTSVMGCDTDCVSRHNKETLKLPLGGSDDEIVVRQKIESFMDWVATTNRCYGEMLLVEYKRELRRQEEARKQEIVRQKRDIQIQKLLAGL